MIDIRLIRDDIDFVKRAISKRKGNYNELIETIEEVDKQRRDIISKRDEMKAVQNKMSKQISAKKSKGEDCSEELKRMKDLAAKIKSNTQKANELEEKQKDCLLKLPNLPHESVKMGVNEDDNEEIRRVMEPRKFDFDFKSHWEIGKDLDILDSQTAAKVTGSRFHFYKGKGARLERAVINFFMDTHSDNGYDEVLPPYMVNRGSMIGTGQLPKFEDDAFKVCNFDYFLIPTAEVPVTNIFRNDILKREQLPIKYAAYSACFRKEVGSAGKDVHGLIRQHQFNKVELVKFSLPENSYDELEKLTNDAENLLKLLKLPYRVVQLCGGDLGFSSAKTYDIEVWMPSYRGYKEISSCSNFYDYQARRANIRYRDDKTSKPQFVHTLNGSGLAVGRTVAAILENYQQEDGTVIVPNVLRDYMKCDIID